MRRHAQPTAAAGMDACFADSGAQPDRVACWLGAVACWLRNSAYGLANSARLLWSVIHWLGNVARGLGTVTCCLRNTAGGLVLRSLG